MTDETVFEGNGQGQGEKGSQPQSSTPNPQPLADVAALQKRIDELEKLYKGVQKGNDKTNAKVLQSVSDLSSQIERITELAKSGKSPVEIEERLLLDEIIRERKGDGLSTRSDGTEPGGQGKVDVQDIARQLNLDVNDRDIAAAVASGNLVNVMKVAMSKATAPSPGPEDEPPLLGGSSGREKSTAQLQADYEKQRGEIARTMRGDAKIKALADLKVQYRKEGLQV